MPQFPMLPLVIDRRHIVNISSGNSLRGGGMRITTEDESLRMPACSSSILSHSRYGGCHSMIDIESVVS